MKLEKITENRRRYDDACATAHALDLVGERWALLVMRELMLGPRRFGDLRSGLPGISANTLTQRLDGLIAHGIVRRERLPPPASAPVYALTEWGYESEPVFTVLGRWAARSPHHDPTLPFSAASLLLSLRAMFDPGRAGGLRMTVGFRIGEETYRATIANGAIETERGSVEGADFVVEGEARDIAGWIYGGVPLADLEAAGALRVTGDRALASSLSGLFPLPDKA
ncbi:winged helix-turn-helix transcriptional regulator [Glacieibacterium frigidum]|uniref:Transcriptional regulator n=1 Tax=Glacieibacterium frigidum TaxID=2593303 RepID=A0A552U8T1_9SPHN|nr:winged helix-turn-helix transcriptional regulator [Glacieibacterium frigidum]TRW14615.1 transcriptional regulator [Glacieibacterium frigidum]